MFEFLEIVRAPKVATVWMNRPERHNAFDANLIAELTRAFERLAAKDKSILQQLQEQDDALEGKRGAKLWAVGIDNGNQSTGIDLPSPPVWDGMAVAQAQHSVRELYDELSKKGVDVKFAIHPVAGRMPGHMNVLLAEAGVPYDIIYDEGEINAEFETADVALVIGANDVVNPQARTDKSSPIYGMPILNADKARNVIVIKRGQGTGFSGIENALFYLDQTRMLYGDGQAKVAELVQAVKAL